MIPTDEQTRLLIFQRLVTSEREHEACFFNYSDQTSALVIRNHTNIIY